MSFAETELMAWQRERTGSGSASIYGGVVVVGAGAPIGGKVATPKPEGYGLGVRGVLQNNRPSNNGLQLTRSARCAPFAFRSWGQSLRAALAAEPECSTGLRGKTTTTGSD